MEIGRSGDYAASGSFPVSRVTWSCNEWAPLAEVVIGTASGAHWPDYHPALAASTPKENAAIFRQFAGRPFAEDLIADAERELDGLARLLEREGIRVVRPDVHPHGAPYATPNWMSSSGLYAAMPRDVALVMQDMIIEAPMAWRCRYFEINAYRTLFKSYFENGARWIAAPRPQLLNEAYTPTGTVTNLEPLFDAADFLRFGDFLVGQLSNVTNQLGAEWLRRHLPPGLDLYMVQAVEPNPMHIDATLIPLAFGKLLVNPSRVPRLPPVFDEWEVRSAPLPSACKGPPLYFSSAWVSMNLLSLDPDRVMVEAQEHEMIAFLKDWGLEPIPIPFRSFQALGGSFHCATLDIRRGAGAVRSV